MNRIDYDIHCVLRNNYRYPNSIHKGFFLLFYWGYWLFHHYEKILVIFHWNFSIIFQRIFRSIIEYRVFLYFQHVRRGISPLKIIRCEKVRAFFASTLNVLKKHCILFMSLYDCFTFIQRLFLVFACYRNWRCCF